MAGIAWEKTYTSFAGTDIVASIRISDDIPPISIGELQTISYSIHREVSPVRSLGRINPPGFTGGPRTIAGSLILTVFNKSLVYEFLDKMKQYENKIGTKIRGNYVMDEMPPFDVDILMSNEYGQQSRIAIKGIVIVDEGQVMSIEDMLTENTMSFMASDIEVLNEVGAPSYGDNGIETDDNASKELKPPTNIHVDVVGKSVTVTFTKDPNAEYTFLDLWCDQIPDYETKGNSIKFEVPFYNTEYKFAMMSQSKTVSGKSKQSKYSAAKTFVSGDVIGQPTKVSTKAEDTQVHISFVKAPDATSTEVQIVPFNNPKGLSDFEKSFAVTGSIKSAETSGSSVFIQELAKSTKYYIRIRSKSGATNGAWTTIPWNFRTTPWI